MVYQIEKEMHRLGRILQEVIIDERTFQPMRRERRAHNMDDATKGCSAGTCWVNRSDRKLPKLPLNLGEEHI